MQPQQNYNLLGGDPRLTLDGMTGAELQKLGANSLEDVLGIRLFDTFRFKSAAAFAAQDLLAFSKALTDTQTLANDSTTSYTKKKTDTNNKHAKQLPRGVRMKVLSLQIQLIITNFNDTTESAGMASDPTPKASDEAVNSSVNLWNAFNDNVYVEFNVGGKTYEEGLLCHFPSPYGMSGWSGAADEGVAQNGFGRAWRLPIPRWIDSGRAYEVKLTNLNSFTVTRSCKLRVTLEALAHRSIQ